jgi:hypothetical protein
LIEGGQMHKVVAETHLTGNGPIVFSGTRHRSIPDSERETTARIFDLSDEEIGATEFDMVCNVAQGLEGFEPLEEPLVVGNITYDGRLGDDVEHGAITQLGVTLEGSQPVYVLDVPRKYLHDERGEPVVDGNGRHKFEQPSAGQQALVVAELLESSEVAVATSSTYFPSRLGEIVRASFNLMKQGISVPKAEVIAYCPTRLAKVKREDAPAVPTLANMLGEAYKARQTFLSLQAEISS